jgi:D-tagatose-1,6-bisphosphate aldolase subunit GatZ/KbaZ
MQVLDDTMLAQPKHWAKHYPGSSAEQRLLRRYGLSDRCRYYWGEAAVVAAVESWSPISMRWRFRCRC